MREGVEFLHNALFHLVGGLVGEGDAEYMAVAVPQFLFGQQPVVAPGLILPGDEQTDVCLG